MTAEATTKLTIRLPAEHVEFAKIYAKNHGISVTELVDRGLRQLLDRTGEFIAPELAAITGLIPAQVDTREEWRRHQQEKHGA